MAIMATYSLHHLTGNEQIALLRALRPRLAPGGAIVLGDVAFATRADRDACRAQCGAQWDDAEHYLVADELRRALPGVAMEYTQVSACAGLFVLG